ncbi:MAG: T9SS type A sorting domain-containing protein [Ignavibacteriaceae bacterium]|nr:T9SS type A sorting domain-containing protein [Ignavibacteriaceae bacterium]
MMKFKFLFLVFLLFVPLLSAQIVVPIANLKQNNGSGIPVDTGQVFTINGIVTASNQFGNAGPGAVQDETGGISVYGSSFVSVVHIGDSVKVTGILTHFKGLTQIDFNRGSASVVVLNNNNSVEPRVVTLEQIKNQQWNGFEEFESLLIRVNNVTISGSGNFQSGTNYTISDPSGTLTDGFRVDNDAVSIIGSQIPSSAIDVIAILGQYKYGAPFNSGYQLLPRFLGDILDDGSPGILNPVVASNIDTSSFTVYFNTIHKGNSKVMYGLTNVLELGEVVVNDDTTYHKVKIEGLIPATRYYFKASSTNAAGTSISSLQTVSTSSSDTTLGTMNVYFNFSVDTSVAIPGNAAKGNVDFVQKLLSRINAASSSIDLALYSFAGLTEVANALVLAKNRGISIRVVYDSRTTQNSMQQLIDAGIKISKRPSYIDGIMHNKFFVFDAKDSIPNNDWIWTGSWNVTSSETSWKNNVVEINDPTIAAAFTTEFEEMWGSSTNIPNSTNAKFGNFKTDNTPHSFTIGGKPVNLFFSPSDATTSKIINAVNTSNHQIYFGLYTFTRSDIQTVIRNRYDIGVNVRGLIDQINSLGSQFQTLQQYADVFQNNGATLHSKYALIDPSYTDSNPITITGSHNWSNSAENNNDENTLFIYDVYTANQYMQEFKKRYNEVGGTGTFIIPVINDVQNFDVNKFDYHLYQNYPNPFNPVTTIRFEVPYTQHIELKIFDILGREVKTLFNNIAPKGIVTVDFNASGLTSGVYVYRITADNFSASKKLMLIK